MIAGERTHIGSLSDQPRRYLNQSLLLSILLHGLVTVFLVNRDNLGNRVRVVPAQTVRVYVQQASPASTNAEAQKSSAAAVEAVQPVSTAGHKQPVKKAAPKINSRSVPAAAISKASAKNVPSDHRVSALDQFLDSVVLNCDPVEKLSEIRNCDNNEPEPSARSKPRRFERDLALLFKQPVTVTAKFKRDMARVRTLTYELEHLDAMLALSDDKPELLLQRQRQLQKTIQTTIQTINTQYDDLNLLEVLGSGIKAVKKGYEAVRDKK